MSALFQSAAYLGGGILLVILAPSVLVLLMGTNLKNCELVNQRIVNKYKEDAARGVSFLHALHAVGTTELDLDDSRIWHSAEGCP